MKWKLQREPKKGAEAPSAQSKPFRQTQSADASGGLLQLSLPSERSMADGAEAGTRDDLRGGTRTPDVGVSGDGLLWSWACGGAIRRGGRPLERQTSLLATRRGTDSTCSNTLVGIMELLCDFVLPSRRDSSASTSQATCRTGAVRDSSRPRMSLRRSCPSAMLTSRSRVPGHQGKLREGREPDRGLSFVACGRHERAEADEDPDEGTAVGSADANSRITSRLGI